MSMSLSCESAKCTVNCPKCKTEHQVSLDIRTEDDYGDIYPCIASEEVTCSTCGYKFKAEAVEVEIKVIKSETHLYVRPKPLYNLDRTLINKKTGALYKITEIQPVTNKGYTYTLTSQVGGGKVHVIDFYEKDMDNINKYIALEI